MKRIYFTNLSVLAIITLVLVMTGAPAQTAGDGKQHTPLYHAVRIEPHGNSRLSLLVESGRIDEHARISDDAIETTINDDELHSLRREGYTVTILQYDLEQWYKTRLTMSNTKGKNTATLQSGSFRLGSYGPGYFLLEEIYSEIERMKAAHPNVVSDKIEIGKSIENRPIYAWRFGSDVSLDKPQVLYTALHHSREPGGAMVLMYYLWWLLDNKNTDKRAEEILTNRSVWVVPCVNPDGYAFNISSSPGGGGLWRKNRRKTSDTTFGVDLNRNYGPVSSWNSPNGGSSLRLNEETYRGTAAFSEPETQAMREFCNQMKFKVAVNYHTFGNLLIYPLSTVNAESPDSNMYRRLAAAMTLGNRYSAGRTLTTVGYNTRGDSDTWMYSGDSGTARLTRAMTLEVGNVTDGFYAQSDRLLPQCQEMLESNIIAALSASYHVQPLDYRQEYDPSDGNNYLNITLANTGIDSAESMIVSQANLNSFTFLDVTTPFTKRLGSGDTMMLRFRIVAPPSFKNGTRTTAGLTIVHPGYAVTDTFPVTIHKPVVTNIYNGDSTLPSALWQTKRWGIVTDQQIKKRVLDDSPNGKYPRNDTNILQYRPYLDLRGQTSAFLDVNTRWSLDANYDFATLEFSINGGTDWFTLPSRRMKQGVGVNAQEFEQYGFAGNFPEYSNESIDLTDLCGSQLLMRYVVRSDGVNEFDGWKISRIQLRTYQDTGTGVSDSVMPLRVFPNPATTSLNLIGIEGETTVTLYSSIGEQMSVFTYEAQSGIGERIPLPPLSSGVYQLRISNGNTSFMKQVVIAR